MPVKLRPLAERFWERVEKTPTCWLWTGIIRRDGYGLMYVNQVRGLRRAHRVAYELLIGPIPEGLHLDHVWERGCRNRHCVNPAHLEPVTLAENNHRGEKRRRTHCKHGHEFTPDNTLIRSNGTRRCRECNKLRLRSRRTQKWAWCDAVRDDEEEEVAS